MVAQLAKSFHFYRRKSIYDEFQKLQPDRQKRSSGNFSNEITTIEISQPLTGPQNLPTHQLNNINQCPSRDADKCQYPVSNHDNDNRRKPRHNESKRNPSF